MALDSAAGRSRRVPFQAVGEHLGRGVASADSRLLATERRPSGLPRRASATAAGRFGGSARRRRRFGQRIVVAIVLAIGPRQRFDRQAGFQAAGSVGPPAGTE